ncbi:MAG: ribonuclease Z [bacterium]|nr:ribonuclease Z [bacterium]
MSRIGHYIHIRSLDVPAQYLCFITMINFHILGAGGAVPTPEHCPAAYWVGLDDEYLLLDPGPGALVRLVKSGLNDEGVDGLGAIILTHLHPDHSADLLAILFASHSVVCTNTTPLRLFGPPGLKVLLEKLFDIYGSWLTPRSRSLEVVEWHENQALKLNNGGIIKPFKVNHPQDRLSDYAVGYHFTDCEGHTAVFSGDTGPSPELNKAARNVDLLVVECSTPDHLATAGHMSPETVGQLCQDSQPRKTVLTHQYPAAAGLNLVEELSKFYDGLVCQARDGSSFQVGDNSAGSGSEPGPERN